MRLSRDSATLGWTAATWIPIALSVLAISISAYAVFVASQARSDTRAIEGLDLWPVLSLRSEFRRIKETPPHFTVSNVGPVEVVQLEIQVISHRTTRKDKKFRVSAYGSEERRVIAKLPPLSSVFFPFSDHWLNVSTRLGEPPEYNVMEIRLTYRRPPDMRRFVEGAFYFVNPDGRWVSENNSSLTPEIYDPIKEDVFRHAARITHPSLSPSDKLHAHEAEKQF